MNARIAALALALFACGGGAPAPAARPPAERKAAQRGASVTASPEARAIVGARDRDPDDVKLDDGRKPAETLTFYGVRPGMRVAELGAGSGYTTELLARAVGPSGVVYSHNSPMIVERFAKEPWAARLSKPVNANVVKVVREFDDPLPPEAKDLDAVFVVLFYHDLYWLGTDRAKMNAAVARALKPGGVYAVIDHSARDGAGSSEVETLHRIEEKSVRDDVASAGFTVAGEADFLRNPGDARDWNAAPSAAGARRGSSDRFVLKLLSR